MGLILKIKLSPEFKTSSYLSRKLFLLSLFIAQIGCTSSVPHKLEEFAVANGIILLNAGYLPVIKNADGTICYGSQPDALLDVSLSGSLSDVTVGEEESEQALGGRNPNVLIVRDLLFQSCLAESRLNLSSEERKDLFRSTLQLIGDINQASLDAPRSQE